MKLVVLSESAEDEAAIRILVDAILNTTTGHVAPPNLRTRGCSLLAIFPSILKHVHYHTDADAFVVVVDSDDSTTHRQTHVSQDGANQGCRLCQLRLIGDQVRRGLTNVTNRAPLKTAFGLAVPALEAWLRCGVDPHAIEAALIQRQDAKSRALRTQLKRDVYGTDIPGRELRMRCKVDQARRLAEMLDEFERCFPDGFGSFARDIRSW